MITILLAGMLALGPAPQQTDTTLAVRPGGRLQVEAMGGSATVSTWDRDAVRVRTTNSTAPGAGPGAARGATVRQRGGDVVVRTDAFGGTSSAGTTFEITVPRSFHVLVEGINLSVTVEGVNGSVTIDNVEGNVRVSGVTGDVRIESVAGSVTVVDVAGAVTAHSVNQTVRLERVRGDIDAETVNGSIIVRGADAASVHASTINGLIEYDGTVRDGGRYYLRTHNGRITMSVPERANATVTARTRSGMVETAFPVPVTGRLDQGFSFVLGTGGASVELESFNGAIRIVRPATTR
jgi:hypothetical protein